MTGKGAEDPAGQHDPLSRDGNQQIRARETGYQGEVGEEEGCGQGPVEVAQPEDLAEVLVAGVGDMFVGVFDVGVFVGYALAGCEGEVGYEGDGCDEGAEDVEGSFGL